MALSKIDVANMLTGATPVANGGTALTSGFVNGLSVVEEWVLTSNKTSAGDITANLSLSSFTGVGTINAGMSQSSGIFTFPSTGYYLVTFNMQFSSGAADNDYILAQIQYTTNNSSYSNAAFAYASIKNNATYQMCSVKKLFDITDTSNQKVRFNTTSQDNNHYVQCDSNQNGTYAMFMKLGAT